MGQGPGAVAMWEKGHTASSSGDSEDDTAGPDRTGGSTRMQQGVGGTCTDRQAASLGEWREVRTRVAGTEAQIPGSEGLSASPLTQGLQLAMA